MPIYYEVARFAVTGHRVIIKRRKLLKKQITTVVTTIILTFIVVQNAALATVSVRPITVGYEVEVFGAVRTVK